MSKSRLSRELWIEALHKFLGGKNLTELALEYGFNLPHFSTKLKSIAKEEGYEIDYINQIKAQKISRNNGVDRSHISNQYVKNALATLTQWKPIPNFENYEISDSGLVRNSKKEILNCNVAKCNTNNYIRVTLHKNDKSYLFQMHQLVLITFIGYPSDIAKNQVDHLDNNGLNNHISNLEWVTPTENIQRSFERNGFTKKTVCSQGGKAAAKVQQAKAIARLTNLMGNRFISLENGNTTYICERCSNTFTTDVSSKAFRYGWRGVCTPCKRIITKENRLNAKSK